MNKRKQVGSSDCDEGKEENANNVQYNKRLAVSNDVEVAPEYGKLSYWNDRYKFYCRKYRDQLERLVGKDKVKSLIFEDEERIMNNNYRSEPGHSWYYTYDEIHPLLAPLLTHAPKTKIFEIGCGDLPLGNCMQTDGEINSLISRIVCCDFSPAVIKFLKQLQNWNIQPGRTLRLCKEKLPQIEYITADAREVPFPDSSFDLVMDKGTLDAMLSDKEHGVSNSVKAISEMARVFDKNGAAIFIVSHLNCTTHRGVSWLHEVVVPGLKRHDEKLHWSIEAHGKASYDSFYYDSEQSDIDDESVDVSTPPDTNVTAFYEKASLEEGTASLLEDASYSSLDSDELALFANNHQYVRERPGPMVYIIRCFGDQKQSNNAHVEIPSTTFKLSGVTLNVISH